MSKKSSINKRQKIKYSVSYNVYYVFGGSLGASTEAPSRVELLKRMKEIRLKHKNEAEVITFQPIKKTIEIQEIKGKFTVFRMIKNPFIASRGRKGLSRFYNEV